jgi:sporulation protein YlmC with PRC-barrel domain
MGFDMNVEITSLLDQDVYTQKGVFVGRVDDAVLDPENGVVSGLALGDVNKELFDQKGKGIVIPYRWVTAVGDIIIIRHLTRNAKAKHKDG